MSPWSPSGTSSPSTAAATRAGWRWPTAKHRLTWPELDERVNRLANALRGTGVGPGDRILWLGQNSFRVYELLGAAAKIGAMVCPGYWRWAPPEMAFAIEDFSPKVVIWQEEEIGSTVRAARAASPGR